jgi:hypothetical protein
MSVRVRDDDVLIHSSKHDPVYRFKKVHEIIVNGGGLHVPAILITEIQDFPEAIEFIGVETQAGRMEPQWHGWEHVDYAYKTEEEIVSDIIMSQIQFRAWFDCEFTKFYTPWGASAAHIKKACDRLNVEMIDCSDLIRCVHINRKLKEFDRNNLEIMIHWWEGVRRLRNAFRNLNA